MAWLSGWSYRKEITITGQSGAGTNYQVEFDIGDSAGGDFHLEGHCTNFPQDIEVTDNDGTTLLDFWIEDITADPLKMWVEVADDLGSNQTIYVYYGKSGATTNSDGPDTFLQWHGTASANFLDSAVISSSSYIFEVKARQTSAEATLSSWWGIGDTAGYDGDQAFIQSYRPAGSNKRYLQTGNDGVRTEVNEVPAFTQNVWYAGKIVWSGSGSVHGYWDENEIVSGSATNIPNEDMGLKMNIDVGSAEQAWSFVRKYNSPEPAFSSAGSEETPPVTGNPYWYYQMLRRRN